MKKTLDVERRIRESGLRLTPARRAILQSLGISKQPISVEILFSDLQKQKIKIDLVTLYRTLNTFEEKGLAHAVDLGHGKIYFEISSGHNHHHHHIVCDSCNKIEHIDVCGIEQHMQKLKKLGYKNLRHKLEFFGICASCS
jgi:Fur family ferric uptake transcriptional regulator